MLAGRAATWGVRLGWLVQTALLGVQAARENGFPWGTWAGSLNLFVWLVVGAYLIWGCRGAYRLLGLVVMPLAAVLLIVARVGGGTDGRHAQPLLQPLPRAACRARARRVRGLHARVGAVGALSLAGAAAAAPGDDDPAPAGARRSRRSTASPRAPSRSRLPPLTLGIGVGIERLIQRGDRIDALVIATLVTWVVWVAYLVLRTTGWSGRRAAYVALAGFALVILVRLALPVTHFA